jgi:signal transduction histidine kinase/CheY-like chemotaxis protein/HPt (histidine-containing phosphotransfer) domain-containing protein
MSFLKVDALIISPEKMTSGGSSAITVYVASAFYILFSFAVTFINFKNINKRHIPMFGYTIVIFILLVVYAVNPYIIMISIAITFINYLMFFTIENPDLKLVGQMELAMLQAQKANNSKSEFLNSMSHEIKTPLNAIINLSDELEEEPSAEVRKAYTKDIIIASHILLDIVGGILDMAKIETGKMEIVNSNYKPKELFESIVKLIKRRFNDKEDKINFNVKIDEDLPNELYGDKANFQKVILNLLTNAFKYTEVGNVDFTVSSIVENKVCKLIISVEDTGRGIKPEQMDKLFTKFNRLEEDRNTTIEGTGLGLAITKDIIELMGGKIVVQSLYGSGSKFTITLNQAVSDGVSSVQTNEITAKLERPTYNGESILVVDDNSRNILVAKIKLNKYNLKVVEAVTCEEALRKINMGEKYSLLLLDIEFPVGTLNGPALLKELKDKGYSTPIVALTANDTSGDREKYLNMGFDEYVAKPIVETELIKVLNMFLKKEKINSEKLNVSNESLPPITEEYLRNIAKELSKKDEEEKQDFQINAETLSQIEQQTSNNHTIEYLKANGLDVDKALESLGDMETYDDMLKTFLNEIDERMQTAKTHKENKDMPNYAVVVHALKSDLKYFGAYELANIFYEHELKSKENNQMFIDENFDNLFNETCKIIDVFKKYI